MIIYMDEASADATGRGSRGQRRKGQLAPLRSAPVSLARQFLRARF